MKKLRVACFGAGWATTHRHVPAMRATDVYDIVAIVDRDGDRAREVAHHLDVPTAVEGRSIDDLPNPDRVDAITCGTAPFTHFDVVASALRLDKHAITEKPFAVTVEEGEELRRLALDHGVQLCVIHNFQFARSVRQVDSWLRGGRLGTVRGLWALQLSNPRRRLPPWYDDLPLGLFYDESPHLLYLLHHFAGGELPLESVGYVPSTSGGNTPGQLTAQYGGAIPATLAMNFEAPISEWQLLVFGNEAAAAIDVFRDIALFLPNDREHNTRTVVRTSLHAGLGHVRGYMRSGPGHLLRTLRYGNDEVFTRFATAVSTNQPAVGISADDAIRVLRAQHELIGAATRKNE